MRAILRWCCVLAATLACVSANAADEPSPPCEGEPAPAYATQGEPPALRVWTRDGYVWDAPRCTGWGKGEYALLVEVAGRFEYAGAETGLAEKFAQVSRWKRMRYWSVSAQGWRRLFPEAYALSGPARDRRRDDFAESDLAPGSVHHFWLEGRGPVGATAFRLRVLERSAERLVVDIRNALAVRPTLHPTIAAGGYRFLLFFDREDSGVWRYYGITALRGPGGSAVGWFRASYINRAVAIFRYFAGVPMEREPPAAR